jgi:hypothetical protein
VAVNAASLPLAPPAGHGEAQIAGYQTSRAMLDIVVKATWNPEEG